MIREFVSSQYLQGNPEPVKLNKHDHRSKNHKQQRINK
jgi:hypothetical protein